MHWLAATSWKSGGVRGRVRFRQFPCSPPQHPGNRQRGNSVLMEAVKEAMSLGVTRIPGAPRPAFGAHLSPLKARP